MNSINSQPHHETGKRHNVKTPVSLLKWFLRPVGSKRTGSSGQGAINFLLLLLNNV